MRETTRQELLDIVVQLQLKVERMRRISYKLEVATNRMRSHVRCRRDGSWAILVCTDPHAVHYRRWAWRREVMEAYLQGRNINRSYSRAVNWQERQGEETKWRV